MCGNVPTGVVVAVMNAGAALWPESGSRIGTISSVTGTVKGDFVTSCGDECNGSIMTQELILQLFND
jgi:hypothetical protein